VAVWVYVFFIAPQLSGGGVPNASSTEIDPQQLREATRGMVAVLWLVQVGAAAAATPKSANQVPGSAFLLRAAGVQSTLWGTMLAEYSRRLVLFGVFAIATAVAVLWGVGLPTRDPLLMLALLVLFLTAELVGMALRLGSRAAGLRPSRATLVVFGGIGLIVFSLSFGHPMVALSFLSKTPIGDFGEVFLARIPWADADRAATVRIVAVSLVAVPALTWFVQRVALYTWFTGEERDDVGTDRTRVDEWLGLLGIEGPTRAVGWRLWLQSRRKPLVLGLMAVPLLIVGLAIVDPEGTETPLFPLYVGLYAVWMSGVVLTLNPFSSEDETLPHLLAAPGRDVVGGYALTATLVGLPTTVLSIILGGVVIGPVSLIVPATIVSIAVFAGTVPAGIAIGLLLPRVDAFSKRADGPIVPSKFAIAGHSTVYLLLSCPAGIALLVTDGVLFSPIALGGITVTVLCSFGVAVVSFRYAGGRLDALTLE
jgi:hypothetical protein